MAIIDTKNLPVLAPQQFNLTAPGTMGPKPKAPGDPLYDATGGNVRDAFLGGIGSALRLMLNGPGVMDDGVLDPSRFTATGNDRGSPATVAAAASAGGPDRVGGTQVAPQPETTKPAAQPAASTRRAAAGGAASPTQALPALVPGVTGYYRNDGAGERLVPYGYDPGAPGGVPSGGGYGGGGSAAGGAARGGGGGYGGMPAGGGDLIDPRSYFPDVVGQQMAYARKAAADILEQAGSGSELGYSARLRALSSVYLNGLAGVGQGGANAYNTDITNLANEGSRAATSRYVSDNSLLGTEENALAHVQAAGISAAPHAAAAKQSDERAYDTPVPIGQEQVTDPLTNITTMRTMYGMRQREGGMPKPIDGSIQSKNAPQEGSKQSFKGKSYTFSQGQWKAD